MGTEAKVEEKSDVESTSTEVSVAEKMLTELSEARSDKLKFRTMAKEMHKSGEVDKELVKAVMADPKKKKKEVRAEKVCEFVALKVAMLTEVMPGLDPEV